MNDYFRIEMSLFYEETKDGNAKVERRATENYLKSYRMSESSI